MMNLFSFYNKTIATPWLLIFLCVIYMGCQSQNAEKKAQKTETSQLSLSVIKSLKSGSGHGDTIPHFRDYHDILHLLDSFTRKGDYEPIGMLLPYLKQRLEKLTNMEEKLAPKESIYRQCLNALYWQTQEFIFTYDSKDYTKLRGVYKKMHDAYDNVKRNRPGGGLPIKCGDY